MLDVIMDACVYTVCMCCKCNREHSEECSNPGDLISMECFESVAYCEIVVPHASSIEK